MRRIKTYIYIAGIISLFSCEEVTPRKPVVYKNDTFYKESVDRNKMLLNEEIKQIKTIIEADTLHKYINSTKGFWYAYIKKIESETSLPKQGDDALLKYEVSTIDGRPIYSYSDIGMILYTVDQQDIMFKGIRDIILLMKEGEETLAYFPSVLAYGYRGDDNKIGVNTPVKCKISLIRLTKK